MAKVKENSTIQKLRTKAEFDQAVTTLRQHGIDAEVITVIDDCGAELWEKRAIVEDIRNFVQSFANRFALR